MEEMITVQFQITRKSLETLRTIEKNGYAEFRDTKHESLEAFLVSNDFTSGFQTEARFKARNFCDYKDVYELLELGLIDNGDGMAWHTTYYVSKFGKQILEMNKDVETDEFKILIIESLCSEYTLEEATEQVNKAQIIPEINGVKIIYSNGVVDQYEFTTLKKLQHVKNETISTR